MEKTEKEKKKQEIIPSKTNNNITVHFPVKNIIDIAKTIDYNEYQKQKKGEKPMPTPPFQSRLIPYEKEIMKSWFERKTLKQISQKLEEKHNITVPVSTLGAFIKRRRTRPDPHTAPATTPAKTIKPITPTKRKIDPELRKKFKEFIEKAPLKVREEFDLKQKMI